MRSYEFIVKETKGRVVAVPNIEAVIHTHLMQDLPKLLGKITPGLGTAIAVAMIGLDIYKKDWTNLALDSLTVVSPPPAQWAIFATQLVNEYYGYCYLNDDDTPADIFADMIDDRNSTLTRIAKLKTYIVNDLENAFATGKEKLSGKQAQQNFRATQVGMDTPNNPDPRKHPERYPTQ